MNRFIKFLVVICLYVSASFAVNGDYDYSKNLAPDTLPPVENPPQLIILGSDDNSNSAGMDWIVDYLQSKIHSDGTALRMSFYSNTNTWTTKTNSIVKAHRKAYKAGHELGNHTRSHNYLVEVTWPNTDTIRTINECKSIMDSANNDLIDFVGVHPHHIKGFRTPYGQYSDSVFSATVELGFTYDCSIEESVSNDSLGNIGNYHWPYSLNTKNPNDDNYAPGARPSNCYWTSTYNIVVGQQPGFWELPQYYLKVEDTTIVNVMNANVGYETYGMSVSFDYNLYQSFKLNKSQALSILKHSLDQHYSGNRTPMTLGMHSHYYVNFAGQTDFTNIQNYLDRRAVIEEFIDYALAKGDDIWFVSGAQAIAYCMNPVSADAFNPDDYTDIPIQTGIDNPSNITCTDTKGETYNIDSLLDAGKHFLLLQDFSTSPNLALFGKLADTIYSDYGLNQEDLIVMALGISAVDSSGTALVDAYDNALGKSTPFPIVLYNKGAFDLAFQFGKENEANRNWLLHPDRDFEQITTSTVSSIKSLIDNALNDYCNPGDISFLSSELINSGVCRLSWQYPDSGYSRIVLLADSTDNFTLSDSSSLKIFVNTLSITDTVADISVSPNNTSYCVKIFLQNSRGTWSEGITSFTPPYIPDTSNNLLKNFSWQVKLDANGTTVDTSGGLLNNDSLKGSFTFGTGTVYGIFSSDSLRIGGATKSFETVSLISLTYRADTTYVLSLPTAWDEESVDSYYRTLLPSTGGVWKTVSFDLNSTIFNQASWIVGTTKEQPFDKSKMFTIEISSGYQTSSSDFSLAYLKLNGITKGIANVTNLNNSQLTKGGDSITVELSWTLPVSIDGDSIIIKWNENKNPHLDSSSLGTVTLPRSESSLTLKLENKKTNYVFYVNHKSIGNNLAIEKFDTVIVSNSKPTGIGISSTSINEGLDSGSVVGVLSTTDADTADNGRHSYELTAGELNFFIISDTLKTAKVFSKGSLDVAIKTTDIFGDTCDSNFVITVLDTTVPRFDLKVIDFNGTTTNPVAVGEVITIQAAKKPDSEDTVFSFINWSGDSTSLAAVVSDSSESTSVTMPGNNVTVTAMYGIYNFKPTRIMLNPASISGDSLVGTFVGVLSTEDLDTNETFTYVIDTTLPDLTLKNDSIFTKRNFIDSLDYGKKVFSIVTTTDSKGYSFSDTIWVNVLNPDEDQVKVTAYLNGVNESISFHNVGDTVDLSAYNSYISKVFSKWEGNIGFIVEGNSFSEDISVIVQDYDMTFTATYDTTYLLTVISGSGLGYHKEGDTLTIVADDSSSVGKVFKQWIGATSNLDDSLSAKALVTMPNSAITLKAEYLQDTTDFIDELLSDGKVDAMDFASIALQWNNSAKGEVSNLKELAPYTGTLPEISISGDQLFNYKDLSVFAALSDIYPDTSRNLKASRALSGLISVKAIKIDGEIVLNIITDDIVDLLSVSFKIISDNSVKIKTVSNSRSFTKDGAQLLSSKKDFTDGSIYTACRLSEDSPGVSLTGKLCDILLSGKDESVMLSYSLINDDLELIEEGVIEVDLPVNDDFSFTVAPNPSTSFPQGDIIAFGSDYSNNGFTFLLEGFNSLEENLSVNINIFDNLANLVVERHGFLNRSNSKIFWNGCNESGSPLPSGIYRVVIRYQSDVRKGEIIKIVGIKE